jgi:hypothetical protein
MYDSLKHVRRVYMLIADGYQAILGQHWPFDGLKRERRLREILDGEVQRQGSGKFEIIAVRN